MRRLVSVPLLGLCALAPIGGGAAVAAGSVPHLKIEGAAHARGGKVRGGFTVENAGAAKEPALAVTVKLVSAGRRPTKLTVQRASVPALAPGARKRVRIKASVPGKVDSGAWSIVACAGRCVRIGKLDAGAQKKKKSATPTSPPASSASPPTSTSVCTPSSGPIPYPIEEPFRQVGRCGVEYVGFVPASYRASSPMPLLIWAHGCGGEAEGDAWNVGSYAEEAGRGWLALSLGGRDGGCWNPLAESERLVMAALADFEAHFNVDPHRVILSGYSSGGDLAYRTGFRHSSTFAGLIVENSAPFEQTESTQAESLAAATTKFHILHLAHLQDTTYPIGNVRSELAAVKAAGFPVELIEKPGTHYDGNTDRDLQGLLAPTIEEAGWTSP
jgi:predicted esterase